jgi:hypothetical protein
MAGEPGNFLIRPSTVEEIEGSNHDDDLRRLKPAFSVPYAEPQTTEPVSDAAAPETAAPFVTERPLPLFLPAQTTVFPEYDQSAHDIPPVQRYEAESYANPSPVLDFPALKAEVSKVERPIKHTTAALAAVLALVAVVAGAKIIGTEADKPTVPTADHQLNGPVPATPETGSEQNQPELPTSLPTVVVPTPDSGAVVGLSLGGSGEQATPTQSPTAVPSPHPSATVTPTPPTPKETHYIPILPHMTTPAPQPSFTTPAPVETTTVEPAPTPAPSETTPTPEQTGTPTEQLQAVLWGAIDNEFIQNHPDVQASLGQSSAQHSVEGIHGHDIDKYLKDAKDVYGNGDMIAEAQPVLSAETLAGQDSQALAATVLRGHDLALSAANEAHFWQFNKQDRLLQAADLTDRAVNSDKDILGNAQDGDVTGHDPRILDAQIVELGKKQSVVVQVAAKYAGSYCLNTYALVGNDDHRVAALVDRTPIDPNWQPSEN